MYNEQLKLLASKINLVHIPDKFKFGDCCEKFDTFELYEELFDYSYEILHDMPLFSNFNVLTAHKNEIMYFLAEEQNDVEIGEICNVCLQFCFAIIKLLSSNNENS